MKQSLKTITKRKTNTGEKHLEDGVSDGSGLVRALAVEGLGRRAAGRRSPRIRQALEDQAAIVRATAVKALGRSNDAALADRAKHERKP